jgi:hypothetical protein
MAWHGMAMASNFEIYRLNRVLNNPSRVELFNCILLIFISVLCRFYICSVTGKAIRIYTLRCDLIGGLVFLSFLSLALA